MWTNSASRLRCTGLRLLPPSTIVATWLLQEESEGHLREHLSSIDNEGSSLSKDRWPHLYRVAAMFHQDPTLCASCEPNGHQQSSTNQSISTDSTKHEKYLRKRATLRQAVDRENQDGESPGSNKASTAPRRFNTVQVLNKLRSTQKEMLLRWERDEDGWRELPARAWPAFQPNVEQMEAIRQTATAKGCFSNPSIKNSISKECQELLFQIATTLVFYNVDAKAGLQQFKQLAELGHVDSMVACGVILVEGLGVLPNEELGIIWLQKAADHDSSQAFFELGTVYYTGIAEVLDEDVERAFVLFERAAASDHVAATYMMADCLLEGDGVAKSVARAVPLFCKAAEAGHRFARQRIRELLANPDYKARK